MPIIDEFQEANRQYTEQLDIGNLPMPPARHVAVLTCMDARLDPAQFLGLEEGDALVVRNAGGRASDDAIRSLVISQQLLGTTDVVVVHHTDCGMLMFGNDDLRQRLREQLGVNASEVGFLPFADLEESVRDDVAALQASPFIPPDINVFGFVYDIKTGRLLPVE